MIFVIVESPTGCISSCMSIYLCVCATFIRSHPRHHCQWCGEDKSAYFSCTGCSVQYVTYVRSCRVARSFIAALRREAQRRPHDEATFHIGKVIVASLVQHLDGRKRTNTAPTADEDGC